MRNLLDNDVLQSMVDYSFGDHSGVLGGIPQAFMKKANLSNREFELLVEENMSNGVSEMTLFIDNIRLYKRPIGYSDWLHNKPISSDDKEWLSQFDDESLLDLCAINSEMKFHIFTAFEDTPLDEYIWDRIPENVLSINAANAVIFGGKVTPFPHGIERKMYEGYNHHEILEKYMNTDWVWKTILLPKKLLFVAHRTDTGNRASIGELFLNKEWATVTHLPYEEYLQQIKNHKFVLCPSGNGIESSRNWETLYMKRVPIFQDHPYLREMFKEFPALFVEDFSEVTEELLLANDYLFEQAQTMDMNKLTLEYWVNKATQ